jgi:hypothetical protein
MQTEPRDHGLAIVVADRGWVFVGQVKTDGDFVEIAGARCVRRWGTSKGLGELAKLGPRPNTQLDDPADTRIAARALIAIVPCEQSAWNA